MYALVSKSRMVVWLISFVFALLVTPSQAAKPWQTLEDCTLVDNWRNDGDSFKVNWNGGELTIRIYFADTPESDFQYRDRTRAQAEYFGITDEQAVEVGKMAKAYTAEVLKDGFSVRTRWQGVFGGNKAIRKYGTVTTKEGMLAELLVSNGLARIHGMGIGGKTWEEVKILKALEAEAKEEGRGAWGMGEAD